MLQIRGNYMRALLDCKNFRQTLRAWWRKYIVAECPDARLERIRQERIEHIQVCADLREAMQLWDKDR